jgi:hypothetical protein
MKRTLFSKTALSWGLVALAVMCLGVLSAATVTAQTSGASLWMDKLEFAPGEAVTLHFTAPPGLPTNAWIGIIPSSTPHGDEWTNDQHDISYQYLNGMTSGTMTFTAPSTPGTYDFRMHDTDDSGVELKSATFTVVSSGGGGTGAASIVLGKTVFAPGESITLSFTAPPGLPTSGWIGIIPSSVSHGDESTNDQHDISYQYMDGATSGTMTFTAPTTPGTYDFRMNDNDSSGIELTSVTFMVQ